MLRTRISGLAALPLAMMAANGFAIETSTVGTGQAAQASVDAVSMKIDALAAMVSATISATVTPIITCNKARKFYAPSDTRKDVNGCVGVQDYDLAMANNSKVSNSGNRASDYMGVFQNSGNAGLYGGGGTGAGITGESTSYWSGLFSGGTTGYGVYGAGIHGVYGVSNVAGGAGVMGTVANNGAWAGYFHAQGGANGVNIVNNTNTAQLCLNGTCTTSLAASSGGNGIKWGGSYFYGNYGCMSVNAFTGGCSCPSGYSQFGGMSGTSGGYIFYLYECYKGSWNGT